MDIKNIVKFLKRHNVIIIMFLTIISISVPFLVNKFNTENEKIVLHDQLRQQFLINQPHIKLVKTSFVNLYPSLNYPVDKFELMLDKNNIPDNYLYKDGDYIYFNQQTGLNPDYYTQEFKDSLERIKTSFIALHKIQDYEFSLRFIVSNEGKKIAKISGTFFDIDSTLDESLKYKILYQNYEGYNHNANDKEVEFRLNDTLAYTLTFPPIFIHAGDTKMIHFAIFYKDEVNNYYYSYYWIKLKLVGDPPFTIPRYLEYNKDSLILINYYFPNLKRYVAPIDVVEVSKKVETGMLTEEEGKLLETKLLFIKYNTNFLQKKEPFK